MRSLVVGVGDWERGDEAAGLEVARRIADAALEDVTAICWEGAALDLLEAWSGFDRVVVVGAAAPGTEPGRLLSIAADGPDADRAPRLAEALRFANATGRRPARLEVLGIGPAQTEAGAPLSRPVARAARTLAERIRWALTHGAPLPLDDATPWPSLPGAGTLAVWGPEVERGPQESVEMDVRRWEGADACLGFVTGEAAVRGALHASRGGRPRIVAVLDPSSVVLRTIKAHGVAVRCVPGDEPATVEAAIEDGVDQLWLCSPTGVRCDVLDLARLARRAAGEGALTVVDVTDGRSVPLRPLALGADLVVHAGVAALSGSTHVLGGFVAGDAEALRGVAAEREGTDAGMRTEAALRLRDGLRTWPLRAERRSANALAIARHLQRHPRVHDVRYPGLPNHPAREAVPTYGPYGHGPTLTFALHEDGGSANRDPVTDLGEAEAVLARLRWAHPEDGTRTISDGVATLAGTVLSGDDARLRLTCGIEDLDDLLDDLENALIAR
jgi:hydrogenase maturation protease